ncbi:MAG: MGMT family protein [Candidatus Omnitrophica bacterium]|nr:MGMT family protein [Candidatus Omnitrophota bacterium]
MLKNTPFQIKVFQAVCQIPFGQTRSYKWVAKKAGSPNGYRAVGTALKKNHDLFIVPCHRVIKSSGQIGGYSLGSDIKKAILDLEKELTKKR